MSSSPSRRMTIGDFLLRRLNEAGVRHLFGVPGDYNLELLQQLQDTGSLKWIGTCSELNSSYAADGYARLNGVGALLVTNGVGPLSAINGVGGAYSEHVPVICIAGSIPLRSIDRGLGMHHTMADGSFDHFLNAYAHVTAAHARLTPRNAATEIDRLILTAWREKLPVYMELPSDIACELSAGLERCLEKRVRTDNVTAGRVATGEHRRPRRSCLLCPIMELPKPNPLSGNN